MNESQQLKIIKEVFKQSARENRKKELDFSLDDLYNGLTKLRSKAYMKPFLKIKISNLLRTKEILNKISDSLGLVGIVKTPVFYIPYFFGKKISEKWLGRGIKKMIIRKLSRVLADEMYKDKTLK